VSDYDTSGQISIGKSNTWGLEFAVFLAFCREIPGDSLQGLWGKIHALLGISFPIREPSISGDAITGRLPFGAGC
jgi:hypothetical protein